MHNTERVWTRDDYFEFHKWATACMTEITKAKNADYAGTEEDTDPFANFRRVEYMGVASTEQGFLTRIIDKVSRLSTFAQRGTLAVDDESEIDTCLDLANYALLLAGFLRAKRGLDPVPEGSQVADPQE